MIFRFGAFELDEERGELRRAGEPVDVQPKPLALLALLIRERQRIVSQDELFDALWPDTAVTSGSLTRAVSHARKAIGDTHKGSLLRSFPKRGYRFMGEVASAGAPEANAPARPAVRPESGLFVGRAEARTALRTALERTCAGRGNVVLVSGPAGIGKTRLTEVFAEDAKAQGTRVVSGRCREGDGAPPFWLWAQVLRALLAEDALGSEVREIARSGELTGLIPSLAAWADSPAEAPDLPAEQRRFLFFDAVARALASGSRERPLVLILEDLQWANAASLRLLEHLAFELESEPVLLVSTVRDEPRPRGHPVDGVASTLRRRESSVEISLGGLSRGEVALMLGEVLDAPPPADLTSELFARTEGVPLFVREAIRLLTKRGDLSNPERLARRGIALPGQAGELIGRALDALSETCTMLLGAAAVLGRSFSLPDVAAIAGKTRAEALDLLDEATAAGIVEALPDTATGYHFTHALFREAVYEALSGGERARLHLRTAERLEQRHADDPKRVIAELAHHHFQAIAVGDPEESYAYAMEAAAEASKLSAHEQAATHYTQAAAALDHCEDVEPARRLATLLALGEAHRLGGEREPRRRAFVQAMDLARALEARREFARAAIGYCALSEWSPRDEFAREALEEALEGLSESDLVERARLTTRLAYLSISESRRLAEPDGREGARLARASEDPEALQEALYTLHYILAGPESGDLVERRAMVAELSEAATSSALRDTCIIALLDVACDCVMQGDLPAATEMRERVRTLSEDYSSPSMIWHTRVYDTGIALMQGRFDNIEAMATEAMHLGQRIQHPFAVACYSGQIMQLDRERGDDRAVQCRFAPAFDTRKGPTHWVRAVLGRAELAIGNEARAREVFERLVGGGVGELPRGIRFVATIVEIALLCAELGDATRARELYDHLQGLEHLHGVLPVPINYGGPVTRCLARLSETLGLADDAAELYREGMESSRALGARPMMARIGVEWGGLLLRRGDTTACRELASESASIARELGMRAVVAQADALASRASA